MDSHKEVILQTRALNIGHKNLPTVHKKYALYVKHKMFYYQNILWVIFIHKKRIAILFQDLNKMKFCVSVCSHYKNGGRT